jgi:hypothetical protein
MLDGLPPDHGGLSRTAKAVQAARLGEGGVKLVLTPSGSAAEPFSYEIRRFGSDPAEVASEPRNEAALVIDLAECWKGLR